MTEEILEKFNKLSPEYSELSKDIRIVSIGLIKDILQDVGGSLMLKDFCELIESGYITLQNYPDSDEPTCPSVLYTIELNTQNVLVGDVDDDVAIENEMLTSDLVAIAEFLSDKYYDIVYFNKSSKENEE